MREVLHQLNRTKGVLGSLLTAPDGLLIAAELNNRYDRDEVAALSAGIGLTVSAWLERFRAAGRTLVVLDTSAVRLFVSAVRWGFLVVMADKSASTGAIRLDLKAAVTRLDHIRLLSPDAGTEETRAGD